MDSLTVSFPFIRYLCLPFKVFYEGGSILTHLFKRAVQASVQPSEKKLAQRVSIGGVENGGNTCTISVLLQEMAALPEYYDQFLFSPLKREPSESNAQFALRTKLQACFRDCISTIRKGELVKREAMHTITTTMVKLGWQKSTLPFWRKWLHVQAPHIFSLPLSYSYGLYEFVLQLYPEIRNIALMARISESSYQQLFQNSPFIESHAHLLCRVKEDRNKTITLEKTITVGKRRFTLEAIHVSLPTPRGIHAVIYRKTGDQWFLCNDTNVQAVENPPSKHISMLIYKMAS